MLQCADLAHLPPVGWEVGEALLVHMQMFGCTCMGTKAKTRKANTHLKLVINRWSTPFYQLLPNTTNFLHQRPVPGPLTHCEWDFSLHFAWHQDTSHHTPRQRTTAFMRAAVSQMKCFAVSSSAGLPSHPGLLWASPHHVPLRLLAFSHHVWRFWLPNLFVLILVHLCFSLHIFPFIVNNRWLGYELIPEPSWNDSEEIVNWKKVSLAF